MRNLLLASAALALLFVAPAPADALTLCVKRNGTLTLPPCKKRDREITLPGEEPTPSGKTLHRLAETFPSDAWPPASPKPFAETLHEIGSIGGFYIAVRLSREAEDMICELVVTHTTHHFGGSLIGDTSSIDDNPWNLEWTAIPDELITVISVQWEDDVTNRLVLRDHQNAFERKGAFGNIFQAANHEVLRFLIRRAAAGPVTEIGGLPEYCFIGAEFEHYDDIEAYFALARPPRRMNRIGARCNPGAIIGG